MENTLINGEATQVEEASEKIFKTLRDWSESEYLEEMAFLGIDDSNISWERKKILVILYMLSGVKDKDGWFYIDNANLCEICGVNERTITRTKRDFERLGIIKIKRGCKGSPTRYKFFESKIGRLPKISKKTPESTLSTLSGRDFIPANVDEIRKSLMPSVLGSCVGLVDKVDSKTEGKKLVIEGGVQYKEEEQDKEKNQYSDKYGDADSDKYGDAEQYLDQNGDIEQYGDEEQDIDQNGDIEQYGDEEQDIDKDGLVMNYTRIVELLTKLNEKIDNNYNSLNGKIDFISNDCRVLVEGIKKLHSSISSSKNSKETVSSIESNNKEVQASVNKEATVTANCKERDTSSSTSTLDKIMSFQVRSVTEQEQQTRKLQEASKQTSEASTKTRVIDKCMEGERNYVLKKLECEIIKPYKITFMNTNSYDKLIEAKENFYKSVDNLCRVHQDVITSSDIKPFANELRTLFQQKEDELQQEVNNNKPSSKSDGESQVEENNTKEEIVEATDVETSPKEEETNNTRFQHNDKTSTDSENCQEKETATAEPNTVESKNIQVSEADTPNCEEKSKEELDKEFDKQTSTMFLIGDSKKTVQDKKVEVSFQKKEKIVLNEEEQKQFQELVCNQTINGLLKGYSAEDGDKYEVIKNELRKVITRGKYQERPVQAYLNELEYRGYFCNLEDVTVPLESTKEDTVTTTVSTPKSRYQENEEETVEESNSDEPTDEEVAMAATSPYDETKDAIF